MESADLFRQEPRDPAWADRVERKVTEIMTAEVPRLLPGLEIKTIRCRTTICDVTWEASPEADRRASELMMYILPGAFTNTRDSHHYFALAGGNGPYQGVRPGDAQGGLRVLAELRQKYPPPVSAPGPGAPSPSP
jgi:hypothetical protein